jgi:hypothetical protein
LWFRAVLGTSLLMSIIFSSSAFTLGGYAGSISKLSAAIFFFAFGMKMRRNRLISLVFLGISVWCLYLAWDALS